MKYAVILVSMVVLLTGLMVASEWKTDLLGYVDQLRSENVAERSAAAEVILQRKQEALKSQAVMEGIEKIAVQFAATEDRKGTAKTAIELLGNLQSNRSIPLLVEHLTFQVFYKETKRPQPLDDLFPSVGALIKIGEPALNPVLARAEASDDDKVARCAAAVVKGILKTEATSFVQQRAAGQADPQAVQRLLVVQQYLKN